MGEVGTSSPESKSMSVVNTNGDTNGTYHTGDMEPMDIDDNEFESEVTSVNIIHQSKLSLHSVNGEVDEENHDHDDNGLDKISDNKTNKNSEGRVNESSLNGNGIETLGNGINENNQSDMSKSNGSKQDKEKISLLVEEEIHQILDSDDEPPPEVAKRSNSIKLNSIEPMEVDGLVKKNDVKLVENDADKPVVIQSDSEDEQPTRPTPSLKPINIMEIKKATPTVTPATTVETSKVVPSTPVADDDDDDCVVIEDDDEPKAVPPPIQRNIQRQRKPLSKSRDIDMTDNSLLKIQNKSLDSVGSKDIRNFNLQNQISLLGNQTSVYPLTAANLNQQIPPLASLNQSFQMVAAAAAAAATSALLPALTDDMFVLEAPSFIVPYIYEKPPSDKLEEVVKKLEVDIKSTKEDNAENQHSIDGNDKTLVLDSEDGKEQKVDDKTDGKKKRKRKNENGDDSWDEDNTSTDDEASDTEERTKVLIKEAKSDIEAIKTHIETTNKLDSSATTTAPDGAKKSENFFDSPVGKFFMDIGINLVQEHVQADLLKQQKKLQIRSGKEAPPRMQMAINSLIKNLEMSRDRNEPFKFPLKRCEFCNFKSESALVMAHHYESPHLKNNVYRCNFCPYEARPIHDILFHMEAVHNVKAHMEKAPALHQCPNCLFEDNGRAKLTRHTPVCAKRYRPDMNLVPPVEWEPPAKIPKIRARQGLVGTATAYQAMAAQAQRASVASAAAALQRANASNQNTNRGRNSNGRSNTNKNSNKNVLTPQQAFIQQQQALMATLAAAQMKPHQLTQQQLASMALTANFQINSNSQFVQVPSANITNTMNSLNPYTIQPSKPSTSSSTSSKSQQPSISITPLPRQPSSSLSVTPVQSNSNFNSGGRNSTSNSNLNRSTGNNGGNNFSGSKTNFVICEICDGYIKDLDQLRNHMQWMHKVKIHPKMIYNRPPLNCQKCQFRFFTDQGLERHLLGSHGLVTSSMQEAANKGKDSGRCPVCGKIYQWKLLNHVSTDHGMTLKPAHLSYKCTVCTATFGMYKQFENHVYSAHSSVAKKTVDNKKQSSNNSSMGSSSSSNQQKAALSALAADNALKPLRINDEITIIPQPATSTNFKTNSKGAVVID